MSITEDTQSESQYVQESLFDVGPDEEVGYRVPIACQVGYLYLNSQSKSEEFY